MLCYSLMEIVSALSSKILHVAALNVGTATMFIDLSILMSNRPVAAIMKSPG